jgi:hypothetical protein
MMDQLFALRFPVHALHPIEGIDDPLQVTVDKINVTVSMDDPYIVFRADPFSTEEEARAFLPRLWGAVAWMAVSVGTGFAAEMQIDKITYATDPYHAALNLSNSAGLPNTGPVHGIVNGNFPTILPIGKNIRFVKFGSGGSISHVITKENIRDPLTDGLHASNAGLFFADERLRTAVELFCNAQREVSLKSKFLTLMMALEVLTEPALKHPAALALLDTLESPVAAGLATFAEDSDEWHSLEALQRELVFRRETSIRSRVRDLILRTFAHLEDAERNAKARKIVWAYDQRGTLIHKGILSQAELNEGFSIASATVKDVLLARMSAFAQRL